MAYIKSLKMQGFKSFAKQTEILFDKDLSVIVGPNGAGKSNVTDAICFVLGRLSMKSMRASKASNMIYNGGKQNKPADEAKVQMVIDNSDRVFPIPEDVIIERIVRKNGNSIYKMNDKTKTRQEVLDLLAQASIDPTGFNIILQGEIARFIDMHLEERRQIIEEIAGINVYEIRKTKSLHELEKTDEKLKEVSIILRQRTAYLNNIETERNQALKYEKLKDGLKMDKASLLHKQINEKEGDKEKINKQAESKNEAIEKIKENINKLQEGINSLGKEIENIDKSIKDSSGYGQESLNNDITELRSDVTTLDVRIESSNNNLENLKKRNDELKKNIKEYTREVEDLLKEEPEQKKRIKLVKEKEEAFSQIEGKQEQVNELRTKFAALDSRIKHKEEQKTGLEGESRALEKQIQSLAEETEDTKESTLEDIKKKLGKLIKDIEDTENIFLLSSNRLSNAENEIRRLEKIKDETLKLDICPLCKRKFTEEHKKKVLEKTEKELKEHIELLKKETSNKDSSQSLLTALKKDLRVEKENEGELRVLAIKLESLVEKQKQGSEFKQRISLLDGEIKRDSIELARIEKQIQESKEIEDRYTKIKNQLDELRKQEDKNIGLEIDSKKREVLRMDVIIKQNIREVEDIKSSIEEFTQELEEKRKVLEEKEEVERKMHQDFQKFFDKKASLQEKKTNLEKEAFETMHNQKNMEDEGNSLKIAIAKIDAEKNVLQTEVESYHGIELPEKIPSIQELQRRIAAKQEQIEGMGSVNMRALEVYKDVKADYDEVAEKAKKLGEEKEEILNIILEIDKKKKKAFMKVFDAVNENFAMNFLSLNMKGHSSFLELENKENPFEGGVNIVVKISKGKYFDAHSLSGGEKTLVALSLIFAIQKYQPHHFYIFDEIDAALDKRNSERLAGLIKNNIGKAQYIIITHNDALMTEAKSLYGVSMQEGISKILSLKI